VESTAECGDLTITFNVRIAGGGMPPKPVWIVWLPESRAGSLSACLSTTAARGGSGNLEWVAEYERLTAGRRRPDAPSGAYRTGRGIDTPNSREHTDDEDGRLRTRVV
jgi:hypothetical protein